MDTSLRDLLEALDGNGLVITDYDLIENALENIGFNLDDKELRSV